MFDLLSAHLLPTEPFFTFPPSWFLSQKNPYSPGPSPAPYRSLAPGRRERPHHPVLGPRHRLHPCRLSHCHCSVNHREGSSFIFSFSSWKHSLFSILLNSDSNQWCHKSIFDPYFWSTSSGSITASVTVETENPGGEGNWEHNKKGSPGKFTIPIRKSYWRVKSSGDQRVRSTNPLEGRREASVTEIN